jgi:hypothetical protein
MRESAMPDFTTPNPINAVLDIPAGRIQVVAGDRADTTVEILPADAAKARDVRAAEQTTVAYDSGVLRIATPAKNQFLGPSGAIDVTVRLPAGSRLEAKAGGAEFRTDGRLGDIAVEGAYRQTKIDEAESVRLTAMDGDVEVGRLAGPSEISTARGDIRIAEAVRGKVVLRTGAGNVSIGAAAGVSASLDAGISYGRVQNALTNSRGADADLDIHATTGQGDITARSL